MWAFYKIYDILDADKILSPLCHIELLSIILVGLVIDSRISLLRLLANISTTYNQMADEKEAEQETKQKKAMH